jgi:hypothetical protein
MSNFFKKINDSDFTLKEQNSLKDTPKCGNTVYSHKDELLFIGDKYVLKNQSNIDRETDFVWRTGFNDGHPCVFITFNAINERINNETHIICLETNTHVNGNQSINVFEKLGFGLGVEGETKLIEKNNGITYLKMNEIEIGREYCLYICGKLSNPCSVWKTYEAHNLHRDTSNDWKITLNVRPNFRGSNFTYKNLPDYKTIEYMLGTEFNFIAKYKL